MPGIVGNDQLDIIAEDAKQRLLRVVASLESKADALSTCSPRLERSEGMPTLKRVMISTSGM